MIPADPESLDVTRPDDCDACDRCAGTGSVQIGREEWGDVFDPCPECGGSGDWQERAA